MNNKDTRIVWMLDESIANSRPSNWQKVKELETKLVSLVGKDCFRHEVIDPIACLQIVAEKLNGASFSCVIDLTGWLSPVLKELFPRTEIFTDFSMSRVRVVSSPKLETTGYVLSMSEDEINRAKNHLDITRPLIVDDTSFTGRTSIKTMDLWHINPENTTHAFLITNTGNLGSPEKPGAIQALGKLGSKVVFGHELKTPNEDGWHLKDLHAHPFLNSAFELAMAVQTKVRDGGMESSDLASLFANEQFRDILFPKSFSSKEISCLVNDGHFSLADEKLLANGAVHARNPFLWASPYFQEHIDIAKVLSSKDQILGILDELHSLTSDPEAKIEAGLELRRLTGRFNSGKERL